jgi:hypothetical protein
MSRFTRKEISTGYNAWNAEVNDDFINVFDRPIALIKHAGNLTSLGSSYTASSYDQCLAICQYSATAGDGLIFAVSNGTTWVPVNGWELFNRIQFTAVTNTHGVGATEDFIVITGSNTFALTLPAIAGANTGRKITVKHKGTGTVTVTPTGGDTIDGSATHVLGTQYMSFAYISDGTSDWLIV